MSEYKQTSAQWYEALPEDQRNITDPDGWRSVYRDSCEFDQCITCWHIEKITEKEFKKRWAASSVYSKGAPHYPFGRTIQDATEKYLGILPSSSWRTKVM